MKSLIKKKAKKFPNPFRCSKHPNYAGIRKPKVRCEKCQLIYDLKY